MTDAPLFIKTVIAALLTADLALIGLWRLHDLPMDWHMILFSNAASVAVFVVAALLAAWVQP